MLRALTLLCSLGLGKSKVPGQKCQGKARYLQCCWYRPELAPQRSSTKCGVAALKTPSAMGVSEETARLAEVC